MVGVDGGNVQVPRDIELIDIGTGGAAEILGDELIGTKLLADERGLPGEEAGGQGVLVAVPLQFPARIQNAAARGKLAPVVQALAPVDQSPDPVEAFDGRELFPQVGGETSLHIGSGGAVGSRLVIDLVTDDGGVVAVVFGNFANDPLGIAQKIRVGDVHVLAQTVSGLAAIDARHQDLGMLLEHPGWNRVSGRAEDDADMGAGKPFDDAVHPGEFEAPVLGLPEAPGGFADADHVDAGLTHQRDVLLEAVLWHVLFVEGNAVEEGVHRSGGKARGRGCLRPDCDGGQGGGERDGESEWKAAKSGDLHGRLSYQEAGSRARGTAEHGRARLACALVRCSGAVRSGRAARHAGAGPLFRRGIGCVRPRPGCRGSRDIPPGPSSMTRVA